MTADTLAVIVRWRGGDEVDACVRSLLEHGGPRLDGVVLVDSGSHDGGAEKLAKSFPEITVVALDTNIGFAHAANCGAARGRAPKILLLNPDTEVLPDALDRLAASLDDDPRIAGAVPLLLGPDHTPQHRWQLRRLPSVARLASGRPGAPVASTPPTTTRPVPQPAAAAWLIRRSVWEALGGLDESYVPAWWEDVDFCARLKKALDDPAFPAGRGLVVRPDAMILHRGGSSVASLGETAFQVAYHRNLLRYCDRHHRNRFSRIRGLLRLKIAAMSILRPRHRAAWLAAGEAVRTTTPSATTPLPTPTTED